MIILAIDPGKTPGFALYSPPKDWHSCTDWEPLDQIQAQIDAVVVEGQHPRKESSRQSLITLSFGAGFRGGYASARFRAPLWTAVARDWRKVFDPSWGSLEKKVFLNRLWTRAKWREFLPDPNGRTLDELDAIALALSFSLGQDRFQQVTHSPTSKRRRRKK